MNELQSAIGTINAENVSVEVNVTTPSVTATSEEPDLRLRNSMPRTLKQRFVDYFMRKYPITKRIDVRRNKYGKFYARAWYHGESRKNTMIVTAKHYETLVIKMEHKYQGRGIARCKDM